MDSAAGQQETHIQITYNKDDESYYKAKSLSESDKLLDRRKYSGTFNNN